ncbi:MAG: hypothetical protein RE471_09815 [Ferroplasma sp.]|uniref:hypothetical protein n=1 Tax=Ferroplasma sp. TaxID=2591003 RepID=UPI002814B100|nr:hypothetical protein [Ferroplasma sp.]WMT51217.1 MAG: hypothetical protein RE471_09595 [Ferroplasma sp.]WMT51260.1 MAG: hypothetical protein RE471_09815 [Ferroplasma sp.]
MVSKGKKMKISISITTEEKDYLATLVESGKASSMSHAVRLCILSYMLVDSGYNGRNTTEEVKDNADGR